MSAFNTSGIFYSSYNPAELNKKSFADTILRLWPNGSAPLFAMTGQMKDKKALASTHGYFTKTMVFALLTIDEAAGYAAGITTFTVDTTAGVVPGMLFQNALREVFKVLTVPSATSVTVARSHGRIAAQALVDNEVCFCVGNNQTESSNRPTARSITPVYVPNYTTIIRNAWALSDTARASYAEAGFSNITENRQDCMQMHSVDVESKLLFGQAKSPAGSPIEHDTQGIIDAIYEHASGNVQTAGATTTYAQLVTMIEPMFTYQSDLGNNKERMLFGDAQAIKVLHDIGENYGQINLTQKETSFGMMFTEFKTYKGTIRMIEHPLLNGLGSPSGLAVIVDLASMGLAYMDGRKHKVENYDGSKDGSNSGVDAIGGSMLAEFATEFRNPQACGVLNGLTAAA